MGFKNLLRSLFVFVRLDVTKNLKYDRLTKQIMKLVLTDTSNCIDVGCHRAEILEIILKRAPNGRHFAFEPLPFLYHELNERYKDRATIYPFALSDKSEKSTFQYVINAPAYSGLLRRNYDLKKPQIKEIEVETRTLDEIIPADLNIDFVKIDVEGGEMAVLKGGSKLLKKYKPSIVFEFGKGAAEYYGTKAAELYAFLTQEIGLKINTLPFYVKNKPSLRFQEFEQLYNTNKEYYFIAYP